MTEGSIMPDDFDNEETARRAQAAADAAMAEDGQTELFPSGVIDGGKTTLKSLVKPGQSVEMTCSIGKAEVPLRGGGMPDPDKPVRVLVTAVFQSCPPIAQRNDERNPMKVTGWKVRVNLRSEYVERVPDDDVGLIEQRFKAMAEVDPSAAGRLVERLQALMSEQLSVV